MGVFPLKPERFGLRCSASISKLSVGLTCTKVLQGFCRILSCFVGYTVTVYHATISYIFLSKR